MKRFLIIVVLWLGMFSAGYIEQGQEIKSININSAKFTEQYGLKFSVKGEIVTLTTNQVLKARVVNVELFSKIGFKDIHNGDLVKVTLQEGNQFKIQHVNSGNEVTFIYNDNIVDYG